MPRFSRRLFHQPLPNLCLSSASLFPLSPKVEQKKLPVRNSTLSHSLKGWPNPLSHDVNDDYDDNVGDDPFDDDSVHLGQEFCSHSMSNCKAMLFQKNSGSLENKFKKKFSQSWFSKAKGVCLRKSWIERGVKVGSKVSCATKMHRDGFDQSVQYYASANFFETRTLSSKRQISAAIICSIIFHFCSHLWDILFPLVAFTFLSLL